ncbi:MAG: single-stranded-DNA-specific exonuclease RecJ [Acidobacteria bacterium]|nr:single-stranded-DNA-specific exonuclease RecJ [Acidobacteriota bacterium]
MRALIWEHKTCDDEQVKRLAAAAGVVPLVARLLCLRGLGDAEAASRFLRPSLDHLHDPLKLADMPAAVDRLVAALERREKIAVHGDYDVDGITSTVILRRVLEMLGGEVIHFIPERLRDGYGLQPAAIERLHADGARVVVSVDCGIRGADAARRARELGVDLIITDHHEPDLTLPPAFAVINPKRHDCPYPDKNLAGVGVALKLVQALCTRTARERWMPAFVKIAAIGTLADVVPLVGENRVIAKLGLESLSRGPHTVGLGALLEASGLTGKALDSYHIAFMLAPRVNAAGRMSTPDLAMRLLLASDKAMLEEARSLAEQLNVENLRRQREEAEIVATARKIIESDPDVGAGTVLVVAGEGWHRGVIGIVASKLVDIFNRPTIVLSIDGDLAHGSCRSIPRFDMLDGLESCSDVFLRFGGHRQAAGVTMEAGRIRELRARINGFALARLEPQDLIPRLWLDGPMPFGDISDGVAGSVATLAPFGAGNPRPVFYARGVDIVDGPRILKDRHVALTVRQDGRRFRAISWRGVERAPFLSENRTALELAYSLEKSAYQGETFVELSVADIRKLDVPAPLPGDAPWSANAAC